MQEHRKTGFLYADVPAEAVGLRGRCHIEVQLTAGNIISCVIVSENGQQIPQKEAIKKISRLGLLFWTFTPQEPTTQSLPVPVTPVAPEENFTFPRRAMQIEQWQMSTWPRLHRGIFALADGSRSSAKIAAILTTPPQAVDRALRELEAIGAIVMGPYQASDLTSF
ncbi:MAG TPA: hypothetical protein VFN35_36665 [Ktedonobacteraceae bacterium]|nr:hypothetical protein [Ktedonobacteraceae bacterium]